jgi:hypothetical protein
VAAAIAAGEDMAKSGVSKAASAAAISIFGGSDGMALKPARRYNRRYRRHGGQKQRKTGNQSGGIEASANVAKAKASQASESGKCRYIA